VKNQEAARALREVSPARIFARPTADDIWLGPTQESALRQLSQPVPVKVLLGPASSGRSCLLSHLAEQEQSKVAVLTVRGPERYRNNMLRALLDSAGLESQEMARSELRQLLSVYLREQYARSRRVIVQVDDAETLGTAAFREIVRLTEPTGHDEPSPELLLSLQHIDEASSPAAEFVRACTTPNVTVLSWLNATEVGWYIHWRMQRFGLGELFTESAARLIAQSTHGCYGAIDNICQMALLLLRNRDSDHVDVLLVREAIKTLQRQRQRRACGPEFGQDAEVIVTRDGELLHQMSIGERLLIGRSRLNDLALDSAYLSRHHLAFVRGETGYYLSDLNSVNGVLLNGQRVQSAPVGNGDMIRIGPYRIKLVVPNELPRTAAADSSYDELADTSVMPAPQIPEPAYLKVIK
jgi:general secretion pathway protein A